MGLHVLAGTMSDSDQRVAVQTYVPASQREVWRREADGMEMSQAEYVRSMVQAGRRSFGLSEAAEETGNSDANPRGQSLETQVRDVLVDEGPHDWDELVAKLTDDIENRLEDALGELQDENAVRYSGREGGYVLANVE